MTSWWHDWLERMADWLGVGLAGVMRCAASRLRASVERRPGAANEVVFEVVVASVRHCFPCLNQADGS